MEGEGKRNGRQGEKAKREMKWKVKEKRINWQGRGKIKGQNEGVRNGEGGEQIWSEEKLLSSLM